MRHLGILITFLLLCTNTTAISPLNLKEGVPNASTGIANAELNKANNYFLKGNFAEAIESYEVAIEHPENRKAPILKKVALGYSALKDVDHSVEYIEAFFKLDFDPTILTDTGFNSIRTTQQFNLVEDRYIPKFSFLAFIYLYVALIGIYIAAIVHFNKKIDRTAKTLISIFIFIHSIFILHICLNMTNYQYQFPHSFRMSTLFSFLYGPLLYFYFKRITQQYAFKKRDLFHLLPTLVLFLVLFPTYFIPAEEKLTIMIDRSTQGRSIIDLLIIICKLTSLVVYGYFIRKVYLVSKKSTKSRVQNKLWQRNIYIIHVAYILCYAAYGILLANEITFGFLYHLQVVLMASMVMYVGYSANVQPGVFSGSYQLDNQLFLKYEKSGLTHSLSEELKHNLIELLDVQKIYKENDISLESLAKSLNTTRHNASQVINEHFNMNFHELINNYRINEAKHIFNMDHQKNLNIIDVAYEVGYNNKVTFNKAFKKGTNLTPSEYQRASIKVSL